MMTIYQADYNKVILSTQASMFISSVPLDILLHDVEELFRWIDKNVMSSGFVFIDMPGQDRIYRVSVERGGEKLGWRCKWHIGFRNFYHQDDHQYLVAFAREDVHVAKPDKIPYRRCSERTMQHKCEFDSIFVQYLIDNFSKPNDVILDPFCGTGMVPRTARDLNRQGIGIDQRCPFTNEL